MKYKLRLMLGMQKYYADISKWWVSADGNLPGYDNVKGNIKIYNSVDEIIKDIAYYCNLYNKLNTWEWEDFYEMDILTEIDNNYIKLKSYHKKHVSDIISDLCSYQTLKYEQVKEIVKRCGYLSLFSEDQRERFLREENL